jgi:quercetin dioxygenase-like cupin family protein
MKITRLATTELVAADAAHFTGEVHRHDLVIVDEPPSSALLVRFAPGGRTHWHRHPRGQYLHVVEGAGVAQTRGEEPIALRPGDTVYAAPGEEHWHGATDSEALAHLAFSFGATEWVGPVDVD